MTAVAAVSSKDRVLEIGTGSGYQAAVLAEVAGEVYTIELLPELAMRARSVLSELGYDNVHVRTGDGYAGGRSTRPLMRSWSRRHRTTFLRRWWSNSLSTGAWSSRSARATRNCA